MEFTLTLSTHIKKKKKHSSHGVVFLEHSLSANLLCHLSCWEVGQDDMQTDDKMVTEERSERHRERPSGEITAER